MPWCDGCDCYLAPASLGNDARCPTCGSDVDTGDTVEVAGSDVPWHFWLVVAALVAYLGWRLVEGVIWVTGQV